MAALGVVVDQHRGRCLAIAGGQAPRLLHVFGMHADDRADRLTLRRDAGVAQFASASTLAHPIGRGLGLSIGVGNLDIATEADNVIKAKLTEKGKQLLVAEATVGQNSNAARRRHEFG